LPLFFFPFGTGVAYEKKMRTYNSLMSVRTVDLSLAFSLAFTFDLRVVVGTDLVGRDSAT
jgi:hypothetical protein